jgi:hypothetical protein
LFYQTIEAATSKFAVQAFTALVHDASEIEPVFAMLGHEPGGGLIVSADAFNLANRKLIVDLAARHRVPAKSREPGNIGRAGPQAGIGRRLRSRVPNPDFACIKQKRWKLEDVEQ